jgi:hypothetical protein
VAALTTSAAFSTRSETSVGSETSRTWLDEVVLLGTGEASRVREQASSLDCRGRDHHRDRNTVSANRDTDKAKATGALEELEECSMTSLKVAILVNCID